MAEEIKSPVPPPPDGEKKPAAETVAPVAQTASGSDRTATPSPVPPPAAPAAPKPPAAAAPPKPAAAAPTGPVPLPWSSPLVEKYKGRFGSGLDAQSYLGQNYFSVDRSRIPDFLKLLRDGDQFDYCVDITAVHYPKREKQFDVLWILYSFARNERIRVKTQIADGESLPSAVPIWATANWLEREVYDMFGIKFDGHPDLKRILLPDGWKGHPLRKDYGILQQDKEWVQINLGIESGQ
jgi:NADH-quinone oxidoreductase subunit C